MQGFMATLREQRWDDHRYYHHSRINQSLHLVSALSFLYSYLIAWSNPATAAIVAWCLAMTSRQAGHFFFEPKGYDRPNQATHEYKEMIKVGYNLRRKVVLMAVWILAPLPVLFDPTLFGLFEASGRQDTVWTRIGLVWFAVGVLGLLFRTIQLFFQRDVKTGLVWCAKIITDPVHDVMLYYKAPLHLLKGELIDPEHALERHA
jgi:hypothetical protein